MSRQMPPGKHDMLFTLVPGGNITTPQTSSDITTDFGGIHIGIIWEPSQLAANSQSTAKLNFSDAFSGNPIDADVKYDLKILDNKGNQVYLKPGLIAKGGIDTQTINFPQNGLFHIEVTVTGLQKSGQSPDLTRNGVARGIVVVPEFGSSLAGMVMAAAIVGIVGAGILRRSTPAQ
jgi:hypothetical protein